MATSAFERHSSRHLPHSSRRMRAGSARSLCSFAQRSSPQAARPPCHLPGTDVGCPCKNACVDAHSLPCRNSSCASRSHLRCRFSASPVFSSSVTRAATVRTNSSCSGFKNTLPAGSCRCATSASQALTFSARLLASTAVRFGAVVCWSVLLSKTSFCRFCRAVFSSALRRCAQTGLCCLSACLRNLPRLRSPARMQRR